MFFRHCQSPPFYCFAAAKLLAWLLLFLPALTKSSAGGKCPRGTLRFSMKTIQTLVPALGRYQKLYQHARNADDDGGHEPRGLVCAADGV